jgi:hypothetical protein
MDIVDERHTLLPAQGKQILHGVDPIVVLERDSSSGARGQPGEIEPEPAQGGRLSPLRAATVKRDQLGPDQLGHGRLVLELGQGALRDVGAERSRDDELVGVQAQANRPTPGAHASVGEGRADLTGPVELVEPVAELWMRAEGQDLAIDPKCANAVSGAPVDGESEGAGVVGRYAAQVLASVRAAQTAEVTSRGPAEPDRLTDEGTAQPEPKGLDGCGPP